MPYKILPPIIVDYIRYRLGLDQEAGDRKVSGYAFVLFLCSLAAQVVIGVAALALAAGSGLTAGDIADDLLFPLLIPLQFIGIIPLYCVFLPLYFKNVAHQKLRRHDLLMPLHICGLFLTLMFVAAEELSTLNMLFYFTYPYLLITAEIFVRLTLGKNVTRSEGIASEEDQTTYEYQQKHIAAENQKQQHAEALLRHQSNIASYKKEKRLAFWANFRFSWVAYLSMIAAFSVITWIVAILSFVVHTYYQCYILLTQECGPHEEFLTNAFANPYFDMFALSGLVFAAALSGLLLLPYYGIICFLWKRNYRQDIYFMLAAVFNLTLLCIPLVKSEVAARGDATVNVLMLSLLFVSPFCGALHLFLLNKFHARWSLDVPRDPAKPKLENSVI